VDKKALLRKKLSKIMVDFLPQIFSLVHSHRPDEVQLKPDGSPVTALDLALSGLLEQMGHEHFPDVTVYSEENFSDWHFPLLAIDPLDGTKEYILGRPEWVISLGLLEAQTFSGEGWIFNPITKELFTSEMPLVSYVKKPQYRGEVSHSEWDKGLYRNIQDTRIQLCPKGSIAYKLGRLSQGKSDFVISLAPKNIWDIAAGTLLCAQSGIKFYSEGKEVTEVRPIYHPPLWWCFSEISSELSEIFYSPDKDL
jgi:myo-inositol-1(or 4)-monophosphatase